MKCSIKYLLIRLGQHTSDYAIHSLDAVANYLAVGRWLKKQGLEVPTRFKDRYRLFDFVAPELQDAQVLYLEFGVWEGASMRYWAKLLRNEKSILHGFDSFEGLPEKWTHNCEASRGYFSTNGRIPVINDQRIKFFKGWFEETLPKYVLPMHDRLFVNLDADLYSSTKVVLECLKEHITRGTYLYFDDFSDRYEQLKAFDEFLEETGMRVRVIGANQDLSSVIFQRTDGSIAGPAQVPESEGALQCHF